MSKRPIDVRTVLGADMEVSELTYGVVNKQLIDMLCGMEVLGSASPALRITVLECFQHDRQSIHVRIPFEFLTANETVIHYLRDKLKLSLLCYMGEEDKNSSGSETGFYTMQLTLDSDPRNSYCSHVQRSVRLEHLPTADDIRAEWLKVLRAYLIEIEHIAEAFRDESKATIPAS